MHPFCVLPLRVLLALPAAWGQSVQRRAGIEPRKDRYIAAAGETEPLRSSGRQTGRNDDNAFIRRRLPEPLQAR